LLSKRTQKTFLELNNHGNHFPCMIFASDCHD
jgi:hypothetical protein